MMKLIGSSPQLAPVLFFTSPLGFGTPFHLAWAIDLIMALAWRVDASRARAEDIGPAQQRMGYKSHTPWVGTTGISPGDEIGSVRSTWPQRKSVRTSCFRWEAPKVHPFCSGDPLLLSFRAILSPRSPFVHPAFRALAPSTINGRHGQPRGRCKAKQREA